MQAHIDAELSPAERIIVEQHVADCTQCANTLRVYQSTSAALFETLAEDRLRHSLVAPVVAHLPEMEVVDRDDVASVNWRAKHPSNTVATMMRRLPIAAAVVLTILAVVIQYYWPESPEPSASVVGVVTQVSGDAYQSAGDAVPVKRTSAKAFIEPGALLETGAVGTMMVSLAGPSYIKLNHDTRLLVGNDRSIDLEYGTAWLDVGRDGRRFVVHTPSGDVRVLGTTFVVEADENMTTVTVSEGEVHVESAVDKTAFVLLTPGRQASISRQGSPSEPRGVSVRTVTAWAEGIYPDKSAHTLFLDAVQPRTVDGLELPGIIVWRIPTTQGDQAWAVSALRLYWEPVAASGSHCSYELYVYDEDMRPLFKERVDGSVFRDASRNYYEVRVPGGPVKGVNALTVRLVPDFSTGTVESTISVKALAH